MKTRTIAAALLTYIAFYTLPLSANNLEQSVSGSSENENPVSAPVQGIKQAEATNYTVLLNDWLESRILWEQTPEITTSESLPVNTTILEEWVNGQESWEQEAEVKKTKTTVTGSVSLDHWITGIESWEQE